ncbi:alpha/beta fold hydrolase [Pseudoduganella umbonata]|uniref:Alpha/beta hydrolase n=1 Tax=Pseudoduganella umbonata TaxID=864828 RepID=A0A4P8HVU2_9BURK|nr:alpha/beta hydrolase [Pseudoduganella umbonata]MBB3222002.1 pimeloyl-ACP methyl ester carboxylesterase [Pseudoduganella umbonata]QCP14209.1 alpha/beta hydrolase [Pseudoduganella umbonata]
MSVIHIDGVPVSIDGTGPDTILMLHGWPDTAAMWEPQVAALSPYFRCARFTWPGFETGAPRKEHSLDELIALCEQVVREVSPGRAVTLLVHDWGCVFGYQFAQRHPEHVARVIGVDIGDGGSKAHLDEIGLKGKLGIVAYQLWLAAAWKIGGGIGESMTRSFAKKARVPVAPEALTPEKNYPYYSTWTGKYKAMKPFRPACPMLFIYGTRKPFNFHSSAWAAELKSKAGCQVVAMDTDHWPMLRQPALFNDTVIGWLRADAHAGLPAAAP